MTFRVQKTTSFRYRSTGGEPPVYTIPIRYHTTLVRHLYLYYIVSKTYLCIISNEHTSQPGADRLDTGHVPPPTPSQTVWPAWLGPSINSLYAFDPSRYVGKMNLFCLWARLGRAQGNMICIPCAIRRLYATLGVHFSLSGHLSLIHI